MRKIIMFFVVCFYFQSCISMELITVPGSIQITSYDGLQRLAIELKGDWNNVETNYDVRPTAIVEYVERLFNIPDSKMDNSMLFTYEYYHKKYPDYYAKIVVDTLERLHSHNDSSNAILEVKRQFHTIQQEKRKALETKIENILPTYNEKKKNYVKIAACNGMLGTLCVGGLVTIGVFSWVINHCHHPWN